MSGTSTAVGSFEVGDEVLVTASFNDYVHGKKGKVTHLPAEGFAKYAIKLAKKPPAHVCAETVYLFPTEMEKVG